MQTPLARGGEAAKASARAAALTLLRAALSGRGGLERALAAHDHGMALSPSDRAFARALTMATLRRLGPIDRAIDARVTREPPAPVRDLLRLGVAQIYGLGTPPHAAVNATVAEAPKPLRGLVNAILRAQIRGGLLDESPQTLAPGWLFARWQAAFGPVAARAIAGTIADEPATDLTLAGKLRVGLAEELGAETTIGGALRTRRRGDPSTWPGFVNGEWWVQDAAAAVPARLLDLRPGQTALDLCAAPGGKTFQMAAAGARVTAIDRSATRLRRVEEGLARLGLTAEVERADALAWSDGRTFDGVLLDAPCSATGTFRRHPDVLWNTRPGDIASLAQGQTALLDTAATRVSAGGRLIYSVCSLEPEEGEAQVGPFLRRHPEFVLLPISKGEGGAPAGSVAAEGWLRILPTHLSGGLDGFFVARFVHRG